MRRQRNEQPRAIPGTSSRTGLPALMLASSLLLIASLSGSLAANANESVASWVDDKGVTHFGDRHLAPSNAATVNVADANGMVAPKVSATNARTTTRWTMIEQAPKQNPRGWRRRGDGPQSGPIAPENIRRR